MAHNWRIVERPAVSPTVLMDLDDNNPLSVQTDGFSVAPPKLRRATMASLDDGDIETKSAYMDRIVKLPLKMKDGVAAETQAATLQKLGRLLDRRDGAWLQWQSEGETQTSFFHLRRGDYDLQDIALTSTPIRKLMLELSAEPFVCGVPETQTVTITNDPTSGTNRMGCRLGAIKGDVMTPLQLQFATPDAAHRIVIASNSLVSGVSIPTVGDSFGRANSTTALGSPDMGPAAWVAEAGTWGINGARAYLAAGVAAWSAATIDTGQADGTVELTIPTHASDGFIGIKIRSSGAVGSGIAFLADKAWNMSTTAQIGSNYSSVFVSGDRMRVTFSGQTITVFRQVGGVGPWTQVFTATSSVGQTNTKHGLAAFGTTNPQAARLDEFTFAPATPQLPASPYFRSFVSEAINAAPPTDWTISDVADASSLTGTVRRMNHTADTVGNREAKPFSAPLSQWTGTPPGEYRPFIRIAAGSVNVDDLELQNGVNSPAASAGISSASTRDWLAMGEMPIAMPVGTPQLDLHYDLAARLPSAPWTFVVRMEDDDGDILTGSVDLDGLLLIPCSRPGMVSRILTLKFGNTHTGKYVTVDGINGDQCIAIGKKSDAPTIPTYVYPDEQAGGLPVAIPGADNVLYFMATVGTSDATRVTDSKATTTDVVITYLPKYLAAERPATT